jgi:hypothetical protein
MSESHWQLPKPVARVAGWLIGAAWDGVLAVTRVCMAVGDALDRRRGGAR